MVEFTSQPQGSVQNMLVSLESYLCNVQPIYTSSINKLAVRDFVFCSGTYGVFSWCLEEPLADTRPFDPHYFALQTMEFNYQITLSASAFSSAYVQRSLIAKEISLICSNMAVCLFRLVCQLL